MKIEVKNFWIIHAVASCDCCWWTDAVPTWSPKEMRRLRASIDKHISLTCHSVTLETWSSRRYYNQQGFTDK